MRTAEADGANQDHAKYFYEIDATQLFTLHYITKRSKKTKSATTTTTTATVNEAKKNHFSFYFTFH